MTLNHRQPDKIPYSIDFTQKALAAMIKFYGSSPFCVGNL